MRYCNACGDRAVTSCPYCDADACADCIPICDHDARKPSTSGTALVQVSETAEAGHSALGEGHE
jgi:hypothetical protein